MRRLILSLHLWVGIPSALILFVVCLSGTIHVFNKEITQWVDADKFYVPVGDSTLSAEALVLMVEKKNPSLQVSSITVPSHPGKAWLFSLKKKQEEKKSLAASDAGRPQPPKEKVKTTGKEPPKKREKLTQLLVNPYTGTIQGNAQTTTSAFFNTILSLHRWLLMDHKIGSVVTGVAAMLFLFLELTGFVLWVPAKWRSWKKKSAWKAALTIKTSANRKRLNYDLHRVVGFYTFAVITIMALTGPVMGLKWYRKGFNQTLGVSAAPKKSAELKSILPADTLARPLTAGEWLHAANSFYPYTGDVRLSLPGDKSAVVSVTKVRSGFAASAGVDRLTLDQYSNRVISSERFADKRLGEQISSMVKAIHTGDIFGTFSRIIYFIACLFATSLPVTGVFIWVNKSRKKKKARPAAIPSMRRLQPA